MSTKYKAHDNDSAYFITITIVNWIDLFTRLSHKKTLIDSLRYCQKEKGLEIYGYVIMPSHIHLICQAKTGYVLSDIIRDFKKFTSKKLIENIKGAPESRRDWLLERFKEACSHLKRDQQYKLWQDGYHAEELFTNKFIDQKINYIHQNPVKDGIVEKAEEYMYSSARNYAELDGVLEVTLIPRQLITYS